MTVDNKLKTRLADFLASDQVVVAFMDSLADDQEPEIRSALRAHHADLAADVRAALAAVAPAIRTT